MFLINQSLIFLGMLIVTSVTMLTLLRDSVRRIHTGHNNGRGLEWNVTHGDYVNLLLTGNQNIATFKNGAMTLLRDSVRRIHTGHNNGGGLEWNVTHGNYVNLVLTGNQNIATFKNDAISSSSSNEDIPSEQGDLNVSENDLDDLDPSTLFYDDGEVYSDTLWSTLDKNNNNNNNNVNHLYCAQKCKTNS